MFMRRMVVRLMHCVNFGPRGTLPRAVSVRIVRWRKMYKQMPLAWIKNSKKLLVCHSGFPHDEAEHEDGGSF